MNSGYFLGMNLAFKTAGLGELGSAAMGLAKTHPMAAISANMGALGAAGGAMTAPSGHRLGGALKGGLMGAAIPMAGEAVDGMMGQPTPHLDTLAGGLRGLRGALAPGK